jgi:hypothetical protein
MILDTGVRFEYSGHKGIFHWVQLGRNGIAGKHIKNAEIADAGNWCLDNFGVDSLENWFFSFPQKRFHFTNQADMLLFILRWS